MRWCSMLALTLDELPSVDSPAVEELIAGVCCWCVILPPLSIVVVAKFIPESIRLRSLLPLPLLSLTPLNPSGGGGGEVNGACPAAAGCM